MSPTNLSYRLKVWGRAQGILTSKLSHHPQVEEKQLVYDRVRTMVAPILYMYENKRSEYYAETKRFNSG